MIRSCVVGASGYTGAELVKLLALHPDFELCATYVSEGSADSNKPFSALYPGYAHLTDCVLQPLATDQLETLAQSMDAIFLATPHEASHDWMASLMGHNARIFDLSGAFRLQDKEVFQDYYGFPHTQADALQQAVYGLAEYNGAQIANAKLIAVPGCYPTASLLALKPLAQNNLLQSQFRPVINAVSGVSGAGRKATLTNSFCEVSLQAYGVLGHRHQPEISTHLGTQVVFTPHLGNFKRGILATITVLCQPNTTREQVAQAYKDAYQDQPLVRLQDHFPKLDNVVHSPFCDIHWKLDEASGYLVVSSAIDNLLKGASSQAIQCANLAFSLPIERGLC